jgi:hypothetical protein
MQRVKPALTYRVGWIVFSIPWRGKRLGLVIISGYWFFGVFEKVD